MSKSTFYSPETHVIVCINATDLFQLSNENQLKIIKRLNEGYNKNNIKFNLMGGDRIKDLATFSAGAGYDANTEKCYQYLFMEKGETFYNTLIKSPGLKKELFGGYEILYVTKSDDSYFVFDPSDVKGTAGFKPHHNYPDGRHIEPTCFTSFLPQLGSFMLPLLEKHYATLFKVDAYIVEIIVEHNLLDYYTNYHNYREIKRFVIPVDYDPKKSGIVPNIVLKKPVTIAVMIKKHNELI